MIALIASSIASTAAWLSFLFEPVAFLMVSSSALSDSSVASSASLSFGRAIDPVTNAYTTITTFSNSYSAGASLPIFSARRLINSLKQAKLSYETVQSNLEKAMDDVTREVMVCYFDVVYYIGMVDIAQQRLDAGLRSLELAKTQFELGTRSKADLQEVEATVASNEYTLLSQQNALQMAYISLSSAMNYQGDKKLFSRLKRLQS